VMDDKTRRILFTLLQNNKLKAMEGCVSTGKEANVYLGLGAEEEDVAIKVYKTGVLQFKDRDRYVEGDRRFQGVCLSNSRKMVKAWAEKEYRNLNRMVNCGLFAPQPMILKEHIVVMSLIGKGSKAAPRLKDAAPSLNPARLTKVYWSLVRALRRMYHCANLVHGDLSEYNILYHDKKLAIIDVSQAVERTHINADYFLRVDCKNMTAFFYKKGVQTLTPAALRECIMSPMPEQPDFEGATDIAEGAKPVTDACSGTGPAGFVRQYEIDHIKEVRTTVREAFEKDFNAECVALEDALDDRSWLGEAEIVSLEELDPEYVMGEGCM
ncbi:serine/threonine-protein kinase Rio1, partial [Kipferlia bialata]